MKPEAEVLHIYLLVYRPWFHSYQIPLWQSYKHSCFISGKSPLSPWAKDRLLIELVSRGAVKCLPDEPASLLRVCS